MREESNAKQLTLSTGGNEKSMTVDVVSTETELKEVKCEKTPNGACTSSDADQEILETDDSYMTVSGSSHAPTLLGHAQKNDSETEHAIYMNTKPEITSPEGQQPYQNIQGHDCSEAFHSNDQYEICNGREDQNYMPLMSYDHIYSI